MLVIIKSSPDTSEGKRAVKLARDMAADICLIQNAVYFAQRDRLEGFCGTAYVLDEDSRIRGIKDIEKGIKKIDYDGLVDMMAEEDKVIGIF
jgi:sulfur relay protein TusB/DsrH